ncbi:carbonic anhydrase [Echria macrotheca]|uniref:Carbonic anhydrase n=1 Tax=Echria macrotheca TaxID=438768 RepID=A0AAJ0B815_9PEZI|nr:carbonic anhydrase [Echria macrotheca]
MSAIQKKLEAASEQYAASFDKGHLILPPAKKYLVVTCMDARIDPAAAFGIELGDAHVVRNAGGSAIEAIRSIVISQQLLGTTEVLVVKHTDCGMLTFKNRDAYSRVREHLGPPAHAELTARSFDFLPFPELDEAVADDVEFLRDSRLVPEHVTISGWVYDVKSGKTRRVPDRPRV